ncbi:WXG100 family type VII secretion target [Saccharopolyspora tripterygii]
MGDDSNLPPWEDVKKVLDDPNVSDDKKRQLAIAYGQNSDEVWGNGINDEVEPYLDKYDDGYWRLHGEGFLNSDIEQNLKDSYKDAKDESDKAAKKEQEHDQAVKDGKGKLDDAKRKSENGENGGAGAKSGDELLDAGKPGLRFFDRWIPLYEKIENDYGDKTKVRKLDQIHELYDQQRQLNFDKFAKNIEDLKNAEKGMRESVQTMSDKLGGLWKSWTGGASDASQDFFSSKFTPTAQERVIQRVSDSASMTQDTVKSVSSMIQEKAKAALELDKYSERIGEKAEQDWDTTITVANDTEDDTTLRKACEIWGIPIEEDCGDLSDEARDKIKQECHKVVRHTFAKSVEETCSGFVKMCEDTKKHIDEAWKKLNDELGKAEENPFQNPGPADKGGDQKPGGQQPGGQQPGGQQPGGQQGAGGAGAGGAGAGGAGAGGAGAGGAGAGGAGTGAGGGMPPTPEMPKPPEMPEMPQVPGMPGQGGPGGPEGEKVTLGEGQNAVTVQEPGADGKTQVQLMGPDGQPKTYAVDFGQGQPGQVPGQPPADPGGVQTMPAPAPGAPVPGGSQAIPVLAGPDGRAVIHEGDRTITLEQGPGGEMKVSVDNGGGQPPLNQTVDFGDDPKPPTLGAPGTPPGEGIVGGPYPAERPQFDVQPGVPPVEPGTPPAEPISAAPAPDLAGGGAAGGFTTMPAPDTSGFTTMPAADATGEPAPGAPAATTAQSVGVGSPAPNGGDGVQNSFASMAGNLFGDGPDSAAPGQAGSSGLSSLGGGDQAGGAPHGAGSAGLSSLGGDPGGGGQSGGGQSGQGGSSAMGGGMMGGGMMGGGQGGQQGGDQERTNDSPWRTEGQLFDDGMEASNVRFRSVLGEDRDR